MFSLVTRTVAAAIIAATLLFTGFHAGMMGGFAHAMHGSMESAADCMMASCPADGPSGAADCAAHCLASATTEQGVLPPLAAVFTFFAAALAAVFAARTLAPALAVVHERYIGKFLLHQQLATIVLRN